MQTTLSKQVRSRSSVGSKSVELSVETRQLLSLGNQANWHFRILGKAPMPEKPVRLGDWLITPAEMDSSPVPVRALSRIQAVYAAGIRPRGFVMVHEAPKLLSSPDGMGERQQTSHASSTLASWQTSLRNWAGSPVGTIALGVAAISGMTVAALAAVSLAALVLAPLLLVVATGSGLDPILVAVTEDGYWIEIDRWVNEPGR